jgi:hypothetical protein
MTAENLEEFAQDLHQEVLAKSGGRVDEASAAAHLLREEMFTESVLETLDEHNEVDGWELCSYEGKSIGSQPAAKLSAWALSGDGATLDLFITLYHGKGGAHEIGKPEVRRQFELVLGFLKRALGGFHARIEEASDAFVAAQRIHAARDTLASARLFLLTDGVARSLDIVPETLPGIELRYVAWDLEKLSRLHVGARQVIELNLATDYGGAIPCLEAADGEGEYRTFLAFFPAPLLARIYGEHGQRLLERNVRAFLQAKGKVNRGLQKTLHEQPNRFLAYNNGLCCTAAEVRLEGGNAGVPRLAWMKDFQIVNGGQTTASIFHAVKKERLNVGNVTVQVKLTVLSDPEQVTEIVPEISRCANSQNKVNGADFAANGKFHRDLEELSRTVWAPASSGLERGTHWYYERARGSYLDDKGRQGSPARQKEWARQNPPNQKFTKTDLAKYEHAWLGLPHLVCRGAEKNFEAFASRLEDDVEPIVDRIFFEQVAARAIMWRSTEKAFDSLDIQGYRAQSVAYAIAWIAEHSGRRLDLQKIWRDQKLFDGLVAALRIVCQEAHSFLNGQAGNVGEASKKPDTWAVFRGRKIEVGSDWGGLICEAAVVSYPAKKPSAAATAARNAVTEISANSWFALAKWSKEHGFLEPWERSLAFSMGKLVGRGALPSEKQAVQGARIAERARELGFAFDEQAK